MSYKGILTLLKYPLASQNAKTLQCEWIWEDLLA